MCPSNHPEQENNHEQSELDLTKPAISMKESVRATGLGYVTHNEEVQSGRLKTYTVGRRRFTTPDWILEWQADRIKESEEQGNTLRLGGLLQRRGDS